MKYIKISVGIFLVLAGSRFIPHPPNFTSLLALSFYIPVLFGVKFLPILLISFIVTDFFIGFHGIAPFTWGSVVLIGLMSKFFLTNIVNSEHKVETKDDLTEIKNELLTLKSMLTKQEIVLKEILLKIK